MSERINNLKTIKAIAARCGVLVMLHAQGFGNRRVIGLYGLKKDLDEVLGQIQGYHVGWSDSGPEEPDPQPPDATLVAYLYSNRTNWAEAGF
jgi:hypothetical protein